MKKIHLSLVIAMVGGIIGAGIFGVPSVFYRAGVPLGLVYLVVLGCAAALVNVSYAIVASETEGRHRLVGYIRKHIGKTPSNVIGVISVIEFLGALLVYIILGGNFLSVIFGGASAMWSVVFFIIVAGILLLPLRKSDALDRLFTGTLILVVAVIVLMVWPEVKVENLAVVHWENWFSPYGVMLFALGGAAIVPEIVEISRKKESSAIRAAMFGTIIAGLIVGTFGALVVGVCGPGTTEDAIAGLAPFFGRPIVVLGSVFGLLAVATQFVILGSNVRDQFVYDYNIPRPIAWAIAAGMPLVVYLAGARDFVGIIGFLGATMGAAVAFSIVFMARRLMVKKKEFPRLRLFMIPLMILFVAGFVAEIVSFFR